MRPTDAQQVLRPDSSAGVAEAERPEALLRQRSRVPTWLQVLWQNRKARVGLVLLGGFVVVAVAAPLLAPYDPRSTEFGSALPPGGPHPLGTTTAGQDILSQLLHGTRVSLTVGAIAGVLSTAIGLWIGMTAGYARGVVDEILSFFINVGMVVPVLPLIITLAAYAQARGLAIIIFVIAITGWAGGARNKRAQIITLRTRDYVTAAKFAGDGPMRIIFREIMPNMTSLIVAGFMATAAGAIGAEAGLAFLGLGDAASVSWGTMLYWANTSGAMLIGQWTWLFAPGMCLALLLTSFTLINFGVDALSNPSLREG